MKSFREDITWSELVNMLDYDYKSGLFTRRVSAGPAKAGDIAGTLTSDGYILISLKSKTYLAHRLAWFYIHRKWPDKFIDHIDGNPGNNSIYNLREATHQQNTSNRTKINSNNKTGFVGVSYNKNTGKYVARIQNKQLGTFSTAKEAADEYAKHAKLIFGEFYNEHS